tara:strand:- start:330 stop:1052 length:723 start_codon:yes stop_codon:yes gene_type:complete
MAVSIDTVYQRVLALANKEQRGYITPQEFNLLANQAQKTIFESYFYNKNLTRLQGAEQSGVLDESNMTDMVDEKLSPFKDIAIVTSGTTFPTTHTINSVSRPVYRVGRVFRDNMVVEKVSINEIRNYMSSPRHFTTKALYADSILSGKDILVIRNGIAMTSSVTCEVFVLPRDVNWAYVVVNEKALYNSALAVDFELHNSEEDTLVYKILELAGIIINKPGLVGVAGNKDIQEQQAQKIG